MSDSSGIREASFAPGTVIDGQYRIVREIGVGEGAMGAIYEAHDETLDRPVAIKTLRTSLLIKESERETHLERFRQEARLAAKVQHPAVVSIYQFGEHEGVLWFAMEYLPGAKSLHELIEEAEKEGTFLPLEDVRAYFMAIAAGLHATHAVGAIHRDVKTRNILCFEIAEGPSAKVLDFGVAHTEKSDLTQAGQLVGTPTYVSPEQVLAHEQKLSPPTDPRSDQFSLGIAFYRALTGKRPFDAVSEYGLWTAILRDRPPPPSSLRPDLPEGYDSACMRMLAKKLENRFDDMSAVRNALKNIESLGPYEPPEDDEVVPTERPTMPGGLPMVHEGPVPAMPDISMRQSGGGFAHPEEVDASSTEQPKSAPLTGDARDFANLDPDEKPIRTLPRRVRYGLMGTLALVVLIFLAFAYYRLGPQAPEMSGSVLDAPKPDEPDQITAKDLLRDEKEARRQQFIEDDRRSRLERAAAEDSGELKPIAARPKSKRRRSKGKATFASKSMPMEAAAAAATGEEPRRRKSPDGIVSFGPETNGEADGKGKKRLGIPTGAMAEAKLLASLSNQAPNTLVTAALPKGLSFGDIGVVLPKGTKAIGRATYKVSGNVPRVEIRFNKLVFPDRKERTFAAIAVMPNGQAGLVDRVSKKDGRAESNGAEAALDVVDGLLDGVPGGQAGKRFTQDGRQDAREKRARQVVVTVAKGFSFKIQFTKPL